VTKDKCAHFTKTRHYLLLMEAVRDDALTVDRRR
jgi:hypothetical protein